VCPNQTGVNATNTHSGNLQIPTGCQNTGVDLAVQNHCRDIERLCICYAPAVNKPRIYAKRASKLGRLRPTAMYQHDANADLVKYANLFHQIACAGSTGEYLAAGFDDKYLSFEQSYIRCGMFERRNHDCAIVSPAHQAAPII
jgi:hypothetical protein